MPSGEGARSNALVGPKGAMPPSASTDIRRRALLTSGAPLYWRRVTAASVDLTVLVVFRERQGNGGSDWCWCYCEWKGDRVRYEGVRTDGMHGMSSGDMEEVTSKLSFRLASHKSSRTELGRAVNGPALAMCDRTGK